MKQVIMMAALLLILPFGAAAQRFSVSTDLVDYLNLGTLNAEASVAAGRHITANVSVRVNPWTFHKGIPGHQLQNRHQTYAAGIRWWPWNVFSGWWVGCKAQYQEYNRGGILRQRTEEGDAFGLGLSAGYSLMIHPNINLDFGLGGWTGQKVYTEYACPHCGKITGSGTRWFVLPNELTVALMFTF